MTILFRLAGALTLAPTLTMAAAAQNREPSPSVVIEPILERFVSDYAQDPLAQDVVFGIEVEGLRWHVVSKTTDSGRQVDLREGFADADILYFKTDRETLNLVDQGVWNGLTALGAATSDEQTPLDLLATAGFVRGPDYEATIRPLIFHFWTRGTPEIVRSHVGNSRVVHGAPAVALYYDRDFRSAVYRVPAGLGREQAPTLAVPFKRMVLLIGGSARGVIGNKEFSAETGDMILAPPDVPLSFWNASDEETLSFVWLMWGDGA